MLKQQPGPPGASIRTSGAIGNVRGADCGRSSSIVCKGFSLVWISWLANVDDVNVAPRTRLTSANLCEYFFMTLPRVDVDEISVRNLD